MRFGDLIDYGVLDKSWLNFGSDPEHILDMLEIVSLPVGQQYRAICAATEPPYNCAAASAVVFSNCKSLAPLPCVKHTKDTRTNIEDT